MGPKKGKEGITENNWRTSIEEAQLDQENWKVKVIIMEAAATDEDRIYLNKFEAVAVEEKRFVIKNICKTETTFMINQLGERKVKDSVKDDNLRVFEEGQAYLKEKKDIPPDLLALIIKHLILKMKEEYLLIGRQRLEVKEGIRRESTTMVDRAEVRGTVSVKPEPAEPPAPKSKGKKRESEPASQISEQVETKKYSTLLRVRGEEWRDKVYVDDFPTDGPNLYVAITGFVEPFLPGALVKIGIPLTAIVQVRIDSTITKVPTSLLRPTKRGQSLTVLTEKSQKFWEYLQQLRINKNSSEHLKNTAFVVFSPPYWDTESLSGNPSKIYDECCYLLYDVQDLTRQHAHYLENMNIIKISKDIAEDQDIMYYNQQMDDLPLECVTIYSLLDSMIRTVEKSQVLEENSSRSLVSTAVTINMNDSGVKNSKIEKAETLVKQVFNTLCETESNKKSFRITYGEEYENHKDPLIMHYGDIAKNSTFHLENINLDNVVWTSLLSMPIHQLWRNQNRPQDESEAKINFHVNVLLSCFEREDVETAELKRLMHILACRKLYSNRSSLKKKHLPSSTISEFKKVYLKRSVLAEPLAQCSLLLKSCSNHSQSLPSMTKSENLSGASCDESETSRIKYLFDCPDISELVSAVEILNTQPIDHMIDEFEHFEDFSGICAFQIMREAFNKFNCVDYKYCQVTDNIILMFFNSYDRDGIAREEWRRHIPTPLCLQDFFDFVLEEHYDWIQDEEKMYDENMVFKSRSESNDVVDPFAAKSCVQKTDVEFELLIEGSLKFQELVVEEETIPDVTRSSKATSKKTTISANSTEVGSKSSRKPKSSAASTPKNLKQSFMAHTRSNASIEIPTKPFSGYDLGDRRVEVFGKNSTFFSRDGTQVISKYAFTIPTNVEYIILNVVPGNSPNEFWMHKVLGEYVTPDIVDICESFRITTKDQVMINIMKQNYQVPVPRKSMSFTENTKSRESVSKSISEFVSQSNYFHSLFITWPNGLITESVHLDQSPVISHIKQFYSCDVPHLDEDMRCISLNGEVIIFKPSGIIEVLRPDGSFIKIIKYGKIMVEKEEILSETNSDKSKKGKTKERNRKFNKDSKSSKNVVTDDYDDMKPQEYELKIEEFETINTDGSRLKWVNEVSSHVETLLIRTATDFSLGEVFSRRMDGTNILLNKDGVQVVTFPNDTRIISRFYVEAEEIYLEWTEEEKQYLELLDYNAIETATVKSQALMSQKSYNLESNTSRVSVASKKLEEELENKKESTDGYISVQIIYTIEHVNFTTVTVNKSDSTISIDSPNDSTVIMNSNCSNYNILLDRSTTANFNGQTLTVNYKGCDECQSDTNITIKVKNNEKSTVTEMHQQWLTMKDSFSKQIAVNEEGIISIIDETCSSETLLTDAVTMDFYEGSAEAKPRDGTCENCVSHTKCTEQELNWAKAVRFFVLRRDLSCSELVHRGLVDQYKRLCRMQPWSSINEYDTFGDNRKLLSILKPVHLTESEKWLMNSKLANKPKYLTYKDLKKDPGKGFYHWMRPYERFQPRPRKRDTVLPPRLPRAFVLRTLEQQWKESDREQLMGAKELVLAILRYRQVMKAESETILHVPIRDLRSEQERRTDDVIQDIGRRIYEDLKMRLNDDVHSRAKAAITTKPECVSSEMSVDGEVEEDFARSLKDESLVREVEAAEEMSPNLKKYWRRRNEEAKEELFYLHLLREGSVPPYFRNILGGAIWWDMNSVAEDAASIAEKELKGTCARAVEATSKADSLPFM